MTIDIRITQVSGGGIPLRGNDIDTDRIIPARFLKSIVFDGLGEHVFADDRQQEAEQGRCHPFDYSAYQGGKVLVVNKNFGCGSSREHAPQAIYRWGVRAIIGVSFAEIFRSNCQTIGLPVCVVSEEDSLRLQDLIEQNPAASICVDLENLKVTCGEFTCDIDLPAGVRKAFVEGTWDSTTELLRMQECIETTASDLPYFKSWQA